MAGGEPLYAQPAPHTEFTMLSALLSADTNRLLKVCATVVAVLVVHARLRKLNEPAVTRDVHVVKVPESVKPVIRDVAMLDLADLAA